MPARHDFLKLLDDEARQFIVDESTEQTLKAGEDLFCEGDPGDAIYIVSVGSLGAYVEHEGGVRLVGLIGAGETVGEMALISGEPRSATVTAIRDTQLLRLSQKAFDALLEKRPQLMIALSRLLVQRLRKISHGGSHHLEPKCVALLPASKSVDVESVAHRIAAELAKSGQRTIVLCPKELAKKQADLPGIEDSHDRVFLCGSIDDMTCVRMCARQADRILLIADPNGPAGTILPDDILRQRARHQMLDIVFIHKNGAGRPQGIRRWLEAIPANRHFHIRVNNSGDWQRMGRVLNARSIGLVLSGGGARAYAHLGVVKAFEELGLPIDFSGGTSMGAVVAAGVAMEWSADEIIDRIRQTFVSQNPLSDYTFPVFGLVRGKKVERLLEEHFTDRDIADLWRRFYCVSANLTEGGSHIHNRGPICRALRSTVSLPGILPPVVHDKGILVDGAVTNNLPILPMRATHHGPICAIDVARDGSIGAEIYDTDRAGPWYRKLVHAPIISILIRAGTISSEDADRQQQRHADVIMTPPVGDIEINNWQAFDQTIEIGYRHAMEQLPKVLNQLSFTDDAKSS